MRFKTDVAQRTDVAGFVAETDVIENGTELVAAIDAPSVWFDAVPRSILLGTMSDATPVRVVHLDPISVV